MNSDRSPLKHLVPALGISIAATFVIVGAIAHHDGLFNLGILTGAGSMLAWVLVSIS